jgi:hypothetical protein
VEKLDTLGEKIKQRIGWLNGLKEDVENERRDIGAELRHIWEAFEDAKKIKAPAVTSIGAMQSPRQWQRAEFPRFFYEGGISNTAAS